MPRPLTLAAHAAEDRPGLATAAVVALGALAAPLALVAARDPARIVFVTIALAVAVVALARVEIALMLLVASAPLEDAVQLSGNPQLTITKVAGALCFASFALYALSTHRRLYFDRLHVAVLLILALAMVSTLQAEDLASAQTTTIRYASYAALFIVVSQFVGDHRVQRRLAWALVISSGIASAIALNRFLSGESTQAKLPYGDPNDLAYILATTVPIAVWLLLRSSSRLAQAVLLLTLGFLFGAIVLTFSRGALVGLAAALIWHVLTEQRGRLVVVAGVIVVAVVSTFLLIQLNPKQLQTGLNAKEKVASQNVNTRLDAWSAAARLASDHPLGVGPGNFKLYYLKETGRPPGTETLAVVHDAYLDVAAELGVGAMIVFLLYLGGSFMRASVARARGNGPPGLATAVRTALVIACVAGLFLSEQYYAPFWLLGALATAMWREGEPMPDTR
ncbi:MAG TPA: O-antigen ligase family protein [Gaiellaceae bacterium]|nr:O-antigen ligase family protein [Gaiellaceae bacterium]